MVTEPSEPHDNHLYRWVTFYGDTFRFFHAALTYYNDVLNEDAKRIEANPILKSLVSARDERVNGFEREQGRVREIRAGIDKLIKENPEGFDYEMSLSHGSIRRIKSACLLFLERARHQRNEFAASPMATKGAVELLDSQLAKMEEKSRLGILEHATPYPVLAEQIELPATAPSQIERGATTPPSRPVVLDTIPILDDELSERCLDLIEKFSDEGAEHRLDTVVTEATRILDDRLKKRCGITEPLTPKDLVATVFHHRNPRLRISEHESEQEAAFFLFRGVFGIVRNQVHHKIVGTITTQRALQIVGMVDYMLSIIESASRVRESASADDSGTVQG